MYLRVLLLHVSCTLFVSQEITDMELIVCMYVCVCVCVCVKQQGVNVECENSASETALHCAIAHHSTLTAVMLINWLSHQQLLHVLSSLPPLQVCHAL